MEHYTKGENVEEALSRENLPIPNLPKDFLWMKVNAGSKIRSLMVPALKAYKESGLVVWSGSGPAVGKAISCAEILKRSHKEAHQISKITYQRLEERWDPKAEMMDPLVVVREVPSIHILLSKEPLNTEEPGYQPPGSQDVFWKTKEVERSAQPTRKMKTPRLSAEEFAAMGLRTGGNKRSKTANNDSGRTKKIDVQKVIPNKSV